VYVFFHHSRHSNYLFAEIYALLIEKINNQNFENNISLKNLKTALRYFLFKDATDGIEIYSKETWLDKIKNIGIYTENKEALNINSFSFNSRLPAELLILFGNKVRFPSVCFLSSLTPLQLFVCGDICSID
jgi:hypothetical protein